jgi:hypothetical protein
MNVIAYSQRAAGLGTLQTYIDSKLIEVDGSFQKEMNPPEKKKYSGGEHMVFVVCDPSADSDLATNIAEEAPNGEHLVLETGAELGPQSVAYVVASGTAVHVASLGVTLWGSRSEASPAAALTTSGAVADHDQLRQYGGGRPPLGTKVIDGWVVPGDDYQRVREVLMDYREERIELEEAAGRLDTTKKTIRKASDRTDLYRLE